MASYVPSGSYPSARLQAEAAVDRMVEQAQQAAAESAAVVSSTTTTSGTDGTDGSSRPSRPSPRRAYVTMVTTDGGFVAGARVMLASLRQACRLPRAGVEVVVLVTAAVPSSARAALQPLCDEVREVEALENPYATHGGWADSGFTKLWVWGLTEYERVVYVDADCLVLEDLAEVRPFFFAWFGGRRGSM